MRATGILLVVVTVRRDGIALVEELQQAARLKGSGAFQDDFTVVLLEGVA